MSTKGRNRTIRTLSLGLMTGTMMSALCMATSAHAGFNWTPPPAPPKASATPVPGPDMTSAPLAPVDADTMTPAPAPVSGKASTPPAPAADNINWAPATSPAPAEMAASAPPADSASYKEVKGFGKGIPLAMAMNQIVPSDYSYSFAPEINPGTSITWHGDRPWNVVLNEALEPAGLTATISGNTVKIQQASSGNAAPMSFDATPAPHNAASHYSPEQLAAIGRNSGNDHLNYERHKPRDRRGLTEDQASGVDSKAVATQTEAGSAPPPPGGDMMAAGTISHAENEPMPLTGNSGQSAPAVQSMAPAAASAVPRDIHTVSSWQAAKGQSLHDTLSAWCGQSGVNLIWQTDKDFKLPHALDTKGTFTDAVRDLLTAYNSSKPRPVGQLHPNLPKGPPVLVIQNEAGA